MQNDPKIMAKTLRKALAAHNITLTHSACLDIVAKQLGHRDWNVAASQTKLSLPDGWFIAGSQPDNYDMGINPDKPNSPAIIRSKTNNLSHAGFATLMQSLDASAFHGQRLQLTAQLRSTNTDGAVTAWMRIDGAAGHTLQFDNMERRKKDGWLTGTTDWKNRTITLDVTAKAQSIHYGFFLRGSGQAAAKSFNLSQVDDNISTTHNHHLPQPTNLNFQ